MRCRLELSLFALLVVAGCARNEVTTPTPLPQSPGVPEAPAALPETPLPTRPAPKVGLLLPLTGSAASLGQDMLDAAQMALFDVGRTDLELIPRDEAASEQLRENALLSPERLVQRLGLFSYWQAVPLDAAGLQGAREALAALRQQSVADGLLLIH